MKKSRNAQEKINGISKESYMIHGMMRTKKWDFEHHVVPPLSASVTYRLESVERGNEGFGQFINQHRITTKKKPTYIYDRLDEPTRSMLEDQLAFVEDGDVGYCFATGMAAISASIMVNAKAGDEVIFHKTMYGCTYSFASQWLPRYNIGVQYVDLTKSDNLKKSINKNVKVVYFETPSNPTLELVDMKKITEIVNAENKSRKKADRIVTIVDNTFATPRCQRPLNWGINIVAQSLTKNIGGFGTDMGGAIVTSREYDKDIMLYRKDFGGVLGSKSAWPILVYGLPTLIDRGRKQQESAIKIAQFLENHPKIGRVSYPGLKSFPQSKLACRQMVDFDGNFAPGNMIYFTLTGDSEKKCNKLLNYIADNAYAITLAVSLGHIRTLIEKPGSLTHSMIPEEEQIEAKMDKSGIRISVGMENADDIIRDLEKALKAL
ncbi:trans-sulfuration enzyme family protein [candidate division KSB1 bacterium]